MARGYFFPNLSAKVSLADATVPAASLNLPREGTVTFDSGYFVTRDIAIDVYGGFPPKAQILGTGPLAPLGTLATTWYGPAVVAAQYYVPGLGRFHPYAGLGVNYTFFLGTADRALNHVQPADTFGAAFEAGVHYDITPRCTFNVDMKYIAMSTRISAGFETPAGDLPAVAGPGLLGLRQSCHRCYLGCADAHTRLRRLPPYRWAGRLLWFDATSRRTREIYFFAA
jgi:outer membrane protein